MLITSEASRLMLKRGVLHRDLSEFNMLLYPEWGDTGMEAEMMKRYIDDQRARFVEEDDDDLEEIEPYRVESTG